MTSLSFVLRVLPLAAVSSVTLVVAAPLSVPLTSIKLDPTRDRGAISPLIYGTNHRYNGHGTATWDATQHRMHASFDLNHRASGLKSIRYPGGTVASTFEWKKAIGPVSQRSLMQPAKGDPQVATFGLDEAARWCETNGVELVYMYGIGAPNSSPEDAADLVEYLTSPVGQNSNGGPDWAAERARFGRPAPYRIRFFEIANEADGPNPPQRFWLNAIDTVENRAKRGLPFQPQRDSYAPEYCFGGIVKFDRQPLTLRDDLRESAARSDGTAHQRKFTRYYPILPDSENIFVGDERWARVPSLAGARGKVYQMDPTTGEIRFGDGRAGDIPPASAVLSAGYRAHRSGFVDYYAAMKRVNPAVKIFAGYESANIIKTLGAAHPYDGIVVHPYTNEHNIPKATSLADWHQSLMLSSARLGAEIAAYQALIDRTVAPERRGLVRVICTEYGPNRQDGILPDGLGRDNYRFLSTGLYNAAQLLQWMRVGLPHAQRHCTTVGVFGPPPEFAPTPTAEVFKLFSNQFGDRLIGLEVNGNPVIQTATVHTGTVYHGGIARADSPRAPKDAPRLTLPLLEIEASRDSAGNLYLVVLNQSTGEKVRAEVTLGTAAGARTAQVWTLIGDAPNSFNTAERPHAVRHEKSSHTLGLGKLAHDFAPLSVTSIKFSATP